MLAGRGRSGLVIVAGLAAWTLSVCYVMASRPPDHWRLVMWLTAADDSALVYLNACDGDAAFRVADNPADALGHVRTVTERRPMDLGLVDADSVITVVLANDLGPSRLRGDAVEPRSGTRVFTLAPRFTPASVGNVYVGSYYGDGLPAPVPPSCTVNVPAKNVVSSRQAQAETSRVRHFRPPEIHDVRLLIAAALCGVALLGLQIAPLTSDLRRRRRDDKVMSRAVRRRMVARTVTVFDEGAPVATGFLLATEPGHVVHIVTCLHVLQDDERREPSRPLVGLHPVAAADLGLDPAARHEVTVHATDPSRDLAILSLATSGATGGFSLDERASGRLEAFANVFSTPLDGDTERSWRAGWLTDASMSAEGLRGIRLRARSQFERLSVDVLVLNLTALRGASGAPVCDADGQLFAMVIAVSEKGNTTYAIPVSAIAGWEQRAKAALFES